MFWKRKAAAGREAPPAPPVGDLAAVRIFSPIAVIDGWVDLAEQRLSDVLNREDRLSVASIPHQPAGNQWIAMERADMLLVVPPPKIADLHLRRHRVKRNILVLSGHYVVRGLVHMMPGIQLDHFLARSGQHFLPLTDARVTTTAWAEIDEGHPTLLVNVRSTSQSLKIEVLA
ncbi:MAG TPA: hypothetical protein VEW95_11015 [Candidatus Limnocylindrales bacterium]|nr:hypothetical protein [Candidatus Limnocylindrales bacterium]